MNYKILVIGARIENKLREVAENFGTVDKIVPKKRGLKVWIEDCPFSEAAIQAEANSRGFQVEFK